MGRHIPDISVREQGRRVALVEVKIGDDMYSEHSKEQFIDFSTNPSVTLYIVVTNRENVRKVYKVLNGLGLSNRKNIEVEFEKGIPVGVNGKKMGEVELISELNKIGGEHGIGRVDIVENRLVGIKSRGVYETPGGTILMTAHRNLESLCLDRDTVHYKDMIAGRYAELVYYGKWFTPLKEAMDAFIDKTQEYVTGVVKLKLYKGNVIAAGVKSKYSLYNIDLATFEGEDIYNQKDAEGFINLFGLQMKHGRKK